MEEQIKELTLLLIYLTSWEEDIGIAKLQRSWKGYSFDALNELENDKLLVGVRGSKSVGITPAGVERAKELIEKYLSALDNA